MVDTVNFKAEWRLQPDIASLLEEKGYCSVAGWDFLAAAKPDPRTGESYIQLSGVHERLRINVRGKNYVIDWIQASLPRVLHGYNGRLIKNPSELSQAHDRLFLFLSDIATPVESLIEYTRVDLVLNLPGDPKAMTAAHKNARHPWIKSDPIQYGTTGIEIRSREVGLLIYWKQKERADKQGCELPPLSKSVRVELQLKSKKKVRKHLGGDPDYPVGQLDFCQCYRIFRYAWCLFDKDDPVRVPTQKCTFHALIADYEAQGHKTRFGISAWKWYCLKGVKPATINRLRPLIQAAKQDFTSFKWSALLPVHPGSATAVDIDSDGDETVITGLL